MAHLLPDRADPRRPLPFAELRKLIRSALELAHKVTHSDGITRVDAFAAGQATVLIVRTLAEMHGGADA